MTDIAARHVPLDTGNECAYCFYESWPCDAELLRRERDAIQGVWDEHVKECHPNRPLPTAAEAHAKALAEALIWASGSDDFAPGGKARQGWERVAQPALAAYDKDHDR